MARMFREEKNHFDEFKIQNAKSFHENADTWLCLSKKDEKRKRIRKLNEIKNKRKKKNNVVRRVKGWRGVERSEGK